jgi:hypothetical protein
LTADMLADRSPQHRKARFQSVEDRVTRHWPIKLKLDISGDTRQRPQMRR